MQSVPCSEPGPAWDPRPRGARATEKPGRTESAGCLTVQQEGRKAGPVAFQTSDPGMQADGTGFELSLSGWAGPALDQSS